MTRTLILLRHAKSSWGDPTMDDHDRPLNDRGHRDAPRIGRWLSENGFTPDHALCSSARRAQETFEGLGLDVPHTINGDLYLASPRILFKAIQQATHPTVMVVAHNPGIATLAEQLIATPPDHPRFHDYPTAATLVAEFDAPDWRSVEPGTGIARAFVTPHDLPE